MPKKYDVLPLTPLTAHAVAHPPLSPEVVHEDDPALHVLVDYTQRRAPIVSQSCSLEAAADALKTFGVRTLLVANLEGDIIGIVLSEDIHGNKPYQIIQDDRIKRSDITVKRLMTPVSAIMAVDYEDIRHAKIGNVIRTLLDTQQHALLVQEKDLLSGLLVIRGLFSASRISQALGENITDTLSHAKSLIDLQRDSEL